MSPQTILMRRVPQLVVVLIGVTFVAFALLNLLPGNITALILGDQATPEAQAGLAHQMGLDRPFLVQYAGWLGHAAQGDLGSSAFSNQSVWSAVGQRVPVTLELLVLALGFAIVVSIPAAVAAARRPGGLVDRLVGLTAFGALAMPSFMVGLLGILLFSVALKALPASGWAPLTANLPDNLRHAVLPAIALGVSPCAFYTRLLRGDLIEQLTRQDYIVTARAKGVPNRQVLLRHALRNAFFPLLTMIGLTTSLLVGGSVVVESVFGAPGVGQLLVQSISTRDVPMVLGVVVFIAAAVVIVNQLIDVLYGVLDPRVRHERANG